MVAIRLTEKYLIGRKDPALKEVVLYPPIKLPGQCCCRIASVSASRRFWPTAGTAGTPSVAASRTQKDTQVLCIKILYFTRNRPYPSLHIDGSLFFLFIYFKNYQLLPTVPGLEWKTAFRGINWNIYPGLLIGIISIWIRVLYFAYNIRMRT